MKNGILPAFLDICNDDSGGASVEKKCQGTSHYISNLAFDAAAVAVMMSIMIDYQW